MRKTEAEALLRKGIMLIWIRVAADLEVRMNIINCSRENAYLNEHIAMHASTIKTPRKR